MTDLITATRTQLARQVAHWTLATSRLRSLEDLASPEAWNHLERYLGLSLRQHLNGVIERLQRQANLLQAALDAADTLAALAGLRRQLLAFRRQYLRAETTLDFYADAINTRTNPNLAGLLGACDTLAQRSMAQVLDPLDKPTPVVLTYVDKGLGASILKAGLRLWDGSSESPVAAIKIVRHNLLRPTALIHEAGHQVAHIVSWTEELATALETGLREAPPGIAEMWASWASEVAADAFAFMHTGYASVATLHDVVAGEEALVFRLPPPGDPHPMNYLRVLLGVEMCRYFYRAGPWDDLALTWTTRYPLDDADARVRPLLHGSVPLLARVVRIATDTPMRAFRGYALSTLVHPERVRPEVLEELECRLGPALYTSMHWIWTESLRILALTGLRVATKPEGALEALKLQETCMLRLGGALQTA